LAEVRKRELGSIGGDLGSGIIKAFTGVGRDPVMQQKLEAQRQAPVVEYLQRQKMADDKRRLDLSAQKTMPSAASTLSPDPASPASRRAQALVEAVVPGMFTPEQLAMIPETEAETIRQDALASQRIESGRETEVGRGQRSGADREQRARITAQRLNLDYDKMDQQERLALLRITDAREGREAAAAERGTTRALNLAERNVGGFTFDPANPPSPDGAKKMADISVQSKTIEGGLAALEKMYRTSGTEITGAVSGTMGAEWKNLTDMLRNMSNMGVPNGKDYEMLAMQLENPTELKSLLTSKARGLAQMKTVREQVRRLVSATAEAYKYSAATGASQASRRVPVTQALPTGTNGQPTLEASKPRRKRDKNGVLWEEQPDGTAKRVTE